MFNSKWRLKWYNCAIANKPEFDVWQMQQATVVIFWSRLGVNVQVTLECQHCYTPQWQWKQHKTKCLFFSLSSKLRWKWHKKSPIGSQIVCSTQQTTYIIIPEQHKLFLAFFSISVRQYRSALGNQGARTWPLNFTKKPLDQTFISHLLTQDIHSWT